MGNLLITWAPLLPLPVLAGMGALGMLVLALGLLAPRPGHPAPGLALRALAVAGSAASASRAEARTAGSSSGVDDATMALVRWELGEGGKEQLAGRSGRRWPSAWTGPATT